ncbi:MAG: SDR family oxidoreductase [Deltaproteobacteria bacterium]|nr:SDR family oxidoreductase [Deltaproteobacteria bacterium]
MSNRLQGKVAIVVGAGATPGDSLGNGRAVALLFARHGAAVLLVDRDAESAAATKGMIDVEGGGSSVFVADVTRAELCQQMAAECIKSYGRIDILHNNVGIGVLGGPVEVSEADWDLVLDVNLKSVFLTCKHVLPQMERQSSGAIINISSIGAVRYSDTYPLAAYSASKGGVNALTRAIAMQYAAKGIRANAIMPGLIRTPMAVDEPAKRYGLDKEQLARMREQAVPMKRMGEAWDVAYAALFLASDEAKYITGAVLPVDGGLSCKG